MAVPVEAVAAVFQEEELEEHQGLVPGVALPVAWVFGLGSLPFINTTKRPVHQVRCHAAERPLTGAKQTYSWVSVLVRF